MSEVITIEDIKAAIMRMLFKVNATKITAQKKIENTAAPTVPKKKSLRNKAAMI